MTKIDVKLKSLFDLMPGAWGCKDENSVFMYANKEYGQIIGLEHHEDVIGRTDFDMPCDTVNFAEMFREQDKQVIQTMSKMRILDIHPFAGGQWKAYIFTKTPLLDEETNLCVGTIFHGMDVTNVTTLEIGSFLSRMSVEGVSNDLCGQSSYMLTATFNDIKLTDRQSEVLFYILRGKTAKQISLYLNLSSRTIEEYLLQLKYKFNADNKYELIDKAIAAGFLNTIPESIFQTQLSMVMKD